MANSKDTNKLYERLEGIVSPAFRAKKIFFGGLGAGSAGVEMIARCGPAKISGIDVQIVEMSNVARTTYTASEAIAGTTKADALSWHLYEINPHLDTDLRHGDLMALRPDELDELLDVDLIVAGTDSFSAQTLLNTEAVRRKIPAVFIGLHERASGGRIVWTTPGSACYRCVAPERFDLAAGEQELHGERGCIIDSLLVEVVAMRVVLGLLERGEPSAMGRFFDAIAGRNEVVVRADPAYEWGGQLWGAALSDLSPEQAQGLRDLTCSGDSLWLRTERDPNCPECGLP